MTVFKEYLDKFYNAFLNYIFRPTNLKRILLFLISTIVTEAGALTFSKSLAHFLEELIEIYNSGFIYIILRLVEVFFVQGSLLVLVISFFLLVPVVYLFKIENKGNLSIDEFRNELKRSTKKIQNSIKESKTDKQKEFDQLSNDIVVNKLRIASNDLNEHKSYFGYKIESTIQRKEVESIEEWIFSDLKPNESQIAVVEGQAGYGKSVVLKQLLNKLIKKEVPVLAIKSDKLIVENIDEIYSELNLNFTFEELFEKLVSGNERIVFIIDQIDALSLSLSSNRKPLNTYNRLIKRIIENPVVRVVLSCRTFDLEHDPYLQQYRNLKRLPIKKLDALDVKNKLLEFNINVKDLSDKFINFLTIPIHLEIYLRIYDEDLIKEYNTLQELYAEYWRQKLLNNHNANQAVDLIKQITIKMFSDQKITMDKRLFEDKYNKELNYLLSEGFIAIDNNKLQFVHQSFFEYAYARTFIEENKSISQELLSEDKHQGLFIRLGLKHILLFQREVQPNKYIKELNEILLNINTRFHLKLLILNTLGFIENPNNDEKLLIKKLCNENEFLFKLFIESAYSNEWINYLFEDLKLYLYLKNNYENYGNLVYRLFSSKIVYSTQEAIDYLYQLPDFANKKDFITRLLFYTSDFSDERILKLFEDYSDSNDLHSYFQFLENAIPTNPDWVINKLYYHFKQKPDNKIRKSHDSNYYETNVYKELYKTHPKKAIKYFIDLLFFIDKKDEVAFKKSGFNDYYISLEFSFYVPNKDPDNDSDLLNLLCDAIIEFFIKYYKSYPDLVFNIVNKMKYTKSLLLHSLIMPFFIKYKDELIDEIYNYFIQHKEILKEYSLSQLYEFYLRKLIGLSYELFSDEQKENINTILINAIPQREKTKVGYFGKGISSYGRTKWKLLSEISYQDLSSYTSLYKEYQELERKFGRIINKEPEGLTVSYGDRAMKESAYIHMSIKDWKKTFLKYREELSPWEEKVSERGHMRRLEELCRTNPDKYYILIKEIINDSKIPVSPIVYGLSGLTKSEYDSSKITSLFLKLISKKIDDLDLIRVIWMTDYFIAKNVIIEEIVDFLCKIALTYPDKKPLNDDLVTDAINSIRGAAVERLTTCFNDKTLTNKIFNTLEYIADNASPVTRAAAIWKLGYLNNLDKQRNLQLYLRLVYDYNPKLLTIKLHGAHPLLLLIHVDFEKLIPFITKAIEIEETHEVMSHIILFAWFYDYTKSNDLLERILTISKNAKKKVLYLAFQNIKQDKLFDKCFIILNRFLDEDDEDIAFEYEHGFRELKPNFFMDHIDFLRKYVVSNIGKYRDYHFYKYLLDCIKDSPEKEIAENCIELIGKFKNHQKPDIQKSGLRQEPLQVLLDSYSIIREYSVPTPHLEYAMDVFDEMLKVSEYRGNLKRMLNRLDETLL